MTDLPLVICGVCCFERQTVEEMYVHMATEHNVNKTPDSVDISSRDVKAELQKLLEQKREYRSTLEGSKSRYEAIPTSAVEELIRRLEQ